MENDVDKIMDRIVNELLDEKTGGIPKGEERDEALAGLRKLLVDYINSSIIEMLPEDKVDAIIAIPDGTSPEETNAQVNAIVEGSELDIKLIVENAVSKFSMTYLQMSDDEGIGEK